MRGAEAMEKRGAVLEHVLFSQHGEEDGQSSQERKHGQVDELCAAEARDEVAQVQQRQRVDLGVGGGVQGGRAYEGWRRERAARTLWATRGNVDGI